MKIDTSRLKKDKEITKDIYIEALEVLPPERMADNAFLIGEPQDHEGGQARYDLYYIEAGRYYYAGLCTAKTFDSLEDAPVHQALERPSRIAPAIRQAVQIAAGVLAFAIIADIYGFMAWTLSGQVPLDTGYWLGKGTATLLSIII